MAFRGFGSNSGPRGPPGVQPQFGKVSGSTSPQFGFNNDGPPQRSPRLEAQTGVLFDNVGSTAPKRGQSPPLVFGGNPSAVAPSYPPYEARRAHLSPQRMEVPPLAFESSYSVKDYHKPFEEPWSGSHNVEIGPLTEFSKFQAPPQRTRSPPLPSSSKVHLGNSHPTANQGGRVAISPPKLGNRSNLLEKNASLQNQQKSSLLSRNIDAEDAKAKFMNSQVPKRARSPSPPSTEEVLLGNSYSTEVDSEREMQAKAKRLARFSVELSQPVQTNHDQMTHKFSGNRNDKPLVRKFVAEQPSEAAGDSMLTDYEGLESSSVIIGLCPDMCPEPEREERERKGDLDKYERFDGDRNLTSTSLAVKKYNRMAEREADLIRPMPVLQKTMDYLLALLDQPYDASFLGMYNFLWDRMRAIRMDLRMQHIFNQDAITMLEKMIRLHIIAMHELCEYTKGEGFSEGFDAHLNIEQMNKTSVELFQMYDDHKKNGIGVSSEKEFRGYYALLKLDRHPGYKVEPAELSLDLAKMTSEMRQTPEILFARDVARACRTGNFIAFFRLARKATYLQACLMHAHFAKLRTQALASLHSGLQINQGIPISHVAKWMGVEGDEIESLLEYHGFLIKEFEEPYMVKEGPFLNSDKDYCTKCSQLVHKKKSKKIFKDVIATDVLVQHGDQANQVFSAKIDKRDQTKQAFSAKIDKRDHTKQAFSTKIDKCEPGSVHFIKAKTMVHADEEMTDFARDSTSVDDSQVHPIFDIPLTPNQRVESDHQVAEVGLASSNVPSVHHFPQPTPAKVGKVSQMTRQILRNDSLEKNIQSSVLCIPQETMPEGAPQICSSESEQSCFESVLAHSAPQRVAIESLATGETTTSILNIEEEEALIHQEKENEDDITIQQKNEAATAKLKLIMRIWKRRSLKRRELREQRQLAASAALSSLSLGPVIGHINTQLSHVIELDIDQAMRERHERQERSWSRLNISRVIAGILSRRNPDAKCLCWKLIVCSKLYSMEEDMLGHRNQVNSLAGRWLSSKLMGVRNENDDELEFSSPGLSIWKSWASSDYGSSSTCCLSVVRQIKCDKLEDAVNGVSAILFLASERVPLELQKTQLHNILMLLPSGSQLPLLVVSDTYKEEMLNPPTTIIDGLGLHFIDKTRVSSFTVVSLVENHLPGHLEGFFSNDRLVEGLQWLASRSLVQPVLCCVKTRDLVMDHLNSSLELLENMDASIVGPNHCISAFNEALVQSSEKVATVVDKNPAMWPCPEVDLLKFSLEHKVVKSFLPSIGWSSIEKIKPIVNAIQGCALPIFPDLSWLNGGSDMGKEIPNQKSELEKCLVQYLVDSSKMMDWALAAREVSVMLQKGAQLQLHGQKYRIVPRWVAIFKRIFHWRLMSLTTGATSVAYVLESEGKACKKPFEVTPVKFGARDFSATPTSPYLSFEGGETPALPQLSLDEMVEVCCSPIVSGREQLELRVVQPLTGIANKLNEAMGVASACENMEDNEKLREEELFAETGDALLSDCHLSKGTMVVASNEKKEYDRLQKLLAQCNMLQDMIDDKLSIYF